jgi:hypothetical protein
VGDANETKEHNIIVLIVNPSAVSSGPNGWLKAAWQRLFGKKASAAAAPNPPVAPTSGN